MRKGELPFVMELNAINNTFYDVTISSVATGGLLA